MLPPNREGDGQDWGENDPAAKASGRGERFAAGGGLIVTLGFAAMLFLGAGFVIWRRRGGQRLH